MTLAAINQPRPAHRSELEPWRDADDAAEAALHPPHPVDGIGVYSADRGVEDDPAEYLQAGYVLSCKPRPIRSRHHMILENERFKSTILVEDSYLFIVQRPPEDVRRRVDVRIHKPSDRAFIAGGGGGKTRTCANTSPGSITVASPAPPTIATPDLRKPRRVGGAHSVWPSCVQPTWIVPDACGRPQLSVNFHLGR
jgi:hypothetical protein